MDRSPVEARLFGALFVLGQHLNRYADDALERYGVTARQWLLLAVLVRGFPGERPTLSETAAAYGTSRQNVKQIALQLAARGLVELETDPRDRRATRLAVTPLVSGTFDAPEAARHQQEVVAGVFATLEDAELATFEQLIDRCLGTLNRSAAR
ncbi:MarR family winged helix-turn-helix transcriptional regulator [Actinotalea sp. K2]|uniref:MarR family winged helix-turn-helix transcriptional regulator n=1 Tax=Actinotalea sp. K2 TaxID=2939438 RepID=UPI002016BCD3|nr:MarR family transcriptional regulator [Actinotalea sp. K2]MCL3861167.1 MarR family transcriptional regulator [Actinotalea sp. K2]